MFERSEKTINTQTSEKTINTFLTKSSKHAQIISINTTFDANSSTEGVSQDVKSIALVATILIFIARLAATSQVNEIKRGKMKAARIDSARYLYIQPSSAHCSALAVCCALLFALRLMLCRFLSWWRWFESVLIL